MRIALITGASSGFGREIIARLNRYFKVDEIWAVARREDRLLELKNLTAAKIRTFSLDLSIPESVLVLKNALEEEKPEVALLVNSAGFGKIGRFTEIPIEEQENMIALNCSSLTSITYAALPFMKKGGRIMQLASVAAFVPQANFAVYAASKAYVLSFSRALNAELKKEGISVTAVCPGPSRTEFFEVAEKTGKLSKFKSKFMYDPVKIVERALKNTKSGKPVSVYGFFMKLLKVISKILPTF